MLRMPLYMQAMETSEAPSPSTPNIKADTQYAEPTLKLAPTEAFQRYQNSAAEAAAHPPQENGQAHPAEVRCDPQHFTCQSSIPDAPAAEALSNPASPFRVQCFRCLVLSTWRRGAHLYAGQAERKLESMINLAEPAFRACRVQQMWAKDSSRPSGSSHKSRSHGSLSHMAPHRHRSQRPVECRSMPSVGSLTQVS